MHSPACDGRGKMLLGCQTSHAGESLRPGKGKIMSGAPTACPEPRGNASYRRVPVTGVYDLARIAVKPSSHRSRGLHGSSGPRRAGETDLRFPAANEPGNKAAARSPHDTDPLPDEKGEQTGGSGGARRIERLLRDAGILLVSHVCSAKGSGVLRFRDAAPTWQVPPTSTCPSGHLPSCPWLSDRPTDGGR
jgi:hypothetical protein